LERLNEKVDGIGLQLVAAGIMVGVVIAVSIPVWANLGQGKSLLAGWSARLCGDLRRVVRAESSVPH
jgi:hypothetical protein